jgi:hypothetical protein
MRKLNKKQTDEMINFTRQNPSVRANKIMAGLNLLNFKNDESLRQFGVKVSNKMVVVGLKYDYYVIEINYILIL